MSEICSRGPVWSNGTVPEGTLVGRAVGGDAAALTAAEAAAVLHNSAGVGPRTVLYPAKGEATKRVLYHEGSTLYACKQSAAGTVYKSTDNGATWTTLAGALGWEPHVLIRLGSGTLIAVASGASPAASRSTDGGATWASITSALGANFAPLGSTGIVETPSGYVLIGEYGNVANTSYRVLRSTDDGATWVSVLSSPGTDPANDPGHIHCVVWDRVGERLVAQMDRPSPETYSSTDEGATWVKIGTATTVNHPNFVAPMFFATHVAWGYDNENNGKVARLPRADFYSGSWSSVEVVATCNGKAFYDPFPIDESTWLLAGATEKIGSVVPLPGSYGAETVVVSGNGSLVWPGFEVVTHAATTNALGGVRCKFPTVKFSEASRSGRSWVNVPTSGAPYSFEAMPFTVAEGFGSPVQTSSVAGPLVTQNDAGVYGRDTSGAVRQILLMDGNNRVRLANPYSSATPEVRLYEGATGIINVMFSGAAVAGFISDGRMQMSDGKYIEMGSTTGAPRVYSGTGSPEGAQSAPPGSLWLNRSGGAGTSLYVKESGTGNTGWVAK